MGAESRGESQGLHRWRKAKICPARTSSVPPKRAAQVFGAASSFFLRTTNPIIPERAAQYGAGPYNHFYSQGAYWAARGAMSLVGGYQSSDEGEDEVSGAAADRPTAQPAPPTAQPQKKFSFFDSAATPLTSGKKKKKKKRKRGRECSSSPLLIHPESEDEDDRPAAKKQRGKEAKGKGKTAAPPEPAAQRPHIALPSIKEAFATCARPDFLHTGLQFAGMDVKTFDLRKEPGAPQPWLNKREKEKDERVRAHPRMSARDRDRPVTFF